MFDETRLILEEFILYNGHNKLTFESWLGTRDSETIGLLSPTVLARYGKVGAGAPSFWGLNCLLQFAPLTRSLSDLKQMLQGGFGDFFNYARQEECCYRRNGLIGFADFRGEFANCGCQAKDILLDPRSDVSSDKCAKQTKFFLALQGHSRTSV